MKLLVFAHTPPPYHGQSYMVKLMLDGFGGDHRNPDGTSAAATARHGLTCYHINARFSKELEDIGDFRPGKVFLLLGYCLQAIWCRFRYGVTTLYYVPAPGKASALYRDWLVMFLCRPFFPKIIFHWHAAGMANWLETVARMQTRSLTYRMLKHVDLSIVLSNFNRADAEKLVPKSIAVVPVGIPDPCPKFDAEILPRREGRVAARRKLLAGEELSAAELAHAEGHPEIVRVLYLAHGLREKGLFDTLEGVALANKKLSAARSPFRLHLTCIGAFVSKAEQEEFQKWVVELGAGEIVRCLGFVSTEQKHKCLAEADLFCFPTYYGAENQPGNLIESLAFGLPSVTTRWRSIPEMLPSGYSAIVAPKSPQQVAQALCSLLTADPCRALRAHFLKYFTMDQHMQSMAAAIRGVEKE
jgi:glycosyltransferase involved in cell wall biosynthesis